MEYFKSPINYTGGKYKLLPNIIPMFPTKINTFVDLFGGSGTVVLNVAAKNKYYNEINPLICNIVELFIKHDKDEIINHIECRSKEFQLDKVLQKNSIYTKEDEDRNSMIKDNYKRFRDYINMESETKSLDLLTIHYYAFNNLIRVNKKGLFNTPYGNRNFMASKHAPLIENACNKFKDISISNKDFREFDIDFLCKDDFVYIDPPYLLTCADYNKIWNEEIEKELYELCDKLTDRGVKWAMSNMIFHNGIEHSLLHKWSIHNNYNIYSINAKYSGWIGVKNGCYDSTKEVLVTNYTCDPT